MEIARHRRRAGRLCVGGLLALGLASSPLASGAVLAAGRATGGGVAIGVDQGQPECPLIFDGSGPIAVTIGGHRVVDPAAAMQTFSCPTASGTQIQLQHSTVLCATDSGTAQRFNGVWIVQGPGSCSVSGGPKGRAHFEVIVGSTNAGASAVVAIT